MKVDPKIIRYENLPAFFYAEKIDSVFYSKEWIQVLKATYGFEFYTIFNKNTENFIIFAKVNVGGSKKLMSLPFSDYVKTREIHPEEDAALLSFVQQQNPEIPIRYKTGYQADDDFKWGTVQKRAYYHRIPLTDKIQLKKAQSKSFHRAVKKAEKAELKVEKETDNEALTDFYRIYKGLRMNKFGSIPQPFCFFEHIQEFFFIKDQGFMLQAKCKEEVAASMIILTHKNVLYYKFGASHPEYLDQRPNDLLFQHLIDYGFENGFKAIDLGLTGSGESYEGLLRFKEKLGGVRHHITTLETNPEVISAEAKTTKELVQDITKIMVERDMDMTTTDKLSELLYPYFA